MKIKINDQIPDIEIYQLINGEPEKKKLSEILGKDKIILFGLPGAFTSTCSKLHLPGFVENAGKIKEKGISIIKHGDSKLKQKQYEYPVTYQLIKDGRKNKVLSKKINLKINVTMFHGQKDEVVPVSFSKKILFLFTKAKKRMVIIKNGDHSLSQKKNLNKILRELDSFRNSFF